MCSVRERCILRDYEWTKVPIDINTKSNPEKDAMDLRVWQWLDSQLGNFYIVDGNVPVEDVTLQIKNILTKYKTRLIF